MSSRGGVVVVVGGGKRGEDVLEVQAGSSREVVARYGGARHGRGALVVADKRRTASGGKSGDGRERWSDFGKDAGCSLVFTERIWSQKTCTTLQRK